MNLFNKNLIIYLLLISIILFLDLWRYYPTYGYSLFQDWLYLIDFKNCTEDNNLTSIHLCNVILEHEFVYPKIWLKFTYFFEDRNFFKFLIIPFIFSYIFICSNILKKESAFINIIFLISPVSILAIQRGNIDLVIFTLIYLFYFSLINNVTKYYSFFALFTAIKLKVYPLALIPIYLIIDNFDNKRLLSLFLSLFLFITLYSSELFTLLDTYNKSGVTLAFSSTVPFKIFNFVTNYSLNYLIITKILLVIIISYSCFSKIKFPNIDNKKEISFLIGSAIIVSGFFLNEGYVYKQIFIIFTLPLIFEYKKTISYKMYLYLLIISFSSIWIEYLTFLVEQIFYIDLTKLKINKSLTAINIIYGLSIILKNLVFWLLNINLILISTKIFLKKLGIKS